MGSPSGSSSLGLYNGGLYGGSASTPGVTGGYPPFVGAYGIPITVTGVGMSPGVGFSNASCYGVPRCSIPGVPAVGCHGQVAYLPGSVGYPPGPVYCGIPYVQYGPVKAPFCLDYQTAFGSFCP
jgi:hypothetical protein